MFWTILKWAATGLLICMLGVGLIATGTSEHDPQADRVNPNNPSAQSADNPPPKKFNF